MRFARTFALSCIALCAAQSATAQQPERKPLPLRSLAEALDVPGPLFHGVRKALLAFSKGDGSAWQESLAPDADLDYFAFSNEKLEKRKLTDDVIRAAMASCFGPYLVDEGSRWTQFSWVCNPKGDTQLSKFVTFRESSELAVTVFFKEGKIASMWVAEPLPVPGGRLLTMDAYDLLKARQ